MAQPAAAQRPCDIMVVDDDRDALESTDAVLRLLGFQTCAFQDPGEALAALGAQVRLLLTDVVMPQMNGVELATAARQRWPCLRVIYVTGYSADLLHDAGVASHQILFKPWTLDALERAVRDGLRE